MTKPVIWTDFGVVVRDFLWRSKHPHRVLYDRAEPVASRVARLRRKYEESRYHDTVFFGRVLDHLLEGCHPALFELAWNLALENDILFDFPEVPERSLTSDEVARLSYLLDDIEMRLTHEETIRHHFLYGLKLLARAYEDLLSGTDPSYLSVPLITPERVTITASYFTSDLMPEDRVKQRAFLGTASKLFDNALALSKLTFEQFEKAPHRIIAPHEYDGDAAHFVADTALASFFETRIPLSIPRHLWHEHAAMFAPSGHGKTQALQAIILDFLENDCPALFIIDSHGDLLRNIRALKPPNLVVIDPEAPHPPALNFLDFRGNPADVVELFGYLMSALSADLSSSQSTMVAFILRLMAAIPGATIDTLRQVMEDPAKTVDKSRFAAQIATLDPIAQDYFANQFYGSGNIAVTKQSVARRIYALMSNDTFAKMFSAKRNTFDAYELMQRKAVVLINTSMKLLRAEASSVFGRYMLAQILSAAYQRVNVPAKDRHLALVIVDEAGPYMDTTTERILAETRKFGVSLLMATQFLEQLPPPVKAAINGNTSIKFAGPVSYSDANALGREMYTTGEFLRSMRKVDKSHTEFACYVKTITPAAVRVSIRFGVMESAEPFASAPALEPDVVPSPDAAPEPQPPAAETPSSLAPQPQAASDPRPTPRAPSDPSKPSEW